MYNNLKDEYLEENEEYYKNLLKGLEHLEKFVIDLKKFQIHIKEKPWYKNLNEIYILDAKKFYKDCKSIGFDINVFNNTWMRKDFKSFVSEIVNYV